MSRESVFENKGTGFFASPIVAPVCGYFVASLLSRVDESVSKNSKTELSKFRRGTFENSRIEINQTWPSATRYNLQY